jgi:hypothetical protein
MKAQSTCTVVCVEDPSPYTQDDEGDNYEEGSDAREAHRCDRRLIVVLASSFARLWAVQRDDLPLPVGSRFRRRGGSAGKPRLHKGTARRPYTYLVQHVILSNGSTCSLQLLPCLRTRYPDYVMRASRKISVQIPVPVQVPR